MSTVFETKLVFNAKGKARRRLRHGRNHLVADAVLLKEGVHAGSAGPIYYPQEFIKKVSPKGKDRPILHNHPVIDSRPVLVVNNSDFITLTGLGELDALSGEAEMKAELWFDEERTRKISPALHQAVINGDTIEVSTGFGLTFDDTPGEWNGEKYVGTAVDAEFDHLAIVTNGKGACDIKKGCGCNVTVNCDCVQPETVTVTKAEYEQLLAKLQSKEIPVSKVTEYVNAIVANKDSGFVEEDREFLTKKGEEWLKARVDGLKPVQNADPPKKEEKPAPPMIEPKKAVTLNEYIEQAPAEVRELLGESLTALQTEKETLVKTITANKMNTFGADWLKTLPMQQLRGMAQLSGHKQQHQPVANFAGAGVVTNGAADEYVEPPLDCKRMDFTKK